MRLFTLFLILSTQTLFGQSEIPIGEWISYLPNQEGNGVTQSNEKIIYATQEAILTIDKNDFSIDYLSKVEGLSDTGISDLTYDKFNDQLIVAYESSILDLISGTQIFPVFNIKNNTNFIDRRINDLFVQNENWLYISTGFGVIQYNLKDLDFGFTVDANQKINKVSGNNNTLAMSGEEGVYVLDFQNELFPNAFSSWKRVSSGLPSNYIAKDVLILNDLLYLLTEDAIYKSDDFENFSLFYQVQDTNFKGLFLKDNNNEIILGLKDGSSSSKVLFFDNLGNPIDEIETCTNRLLDLVVDEKNRIFFADEWNKFRYIDENGNCQKETFKGPFSVEATDISINDDIVYIASGGITENFGNLFGRKGVYILNEGIWENLNQDSNPFYKENDLLQFYQIEAHPTEDKVYIGTFWGGLIEQNRETGEQILYTADNSENALLPQVGNEERTNISGLAFDQDNNLWISSFGASRPLAVLTSEGTWHNFNINSDTKLTDLVVDDNGYVWGVIAGNTGGVIVYDPAGTIKDPTDDRPSKFLNINNTEIPSNLVNSIAKDLDGTIWVGTAEGVVAFDCAAFEASCVGNKRRVEQDGIGAFLLETEDVQAIAVDGANRKWFGTRNGIFVQSPSGEEQIAKYDEENSPLFDNNIKAMAYNEKSGEMFISSNKGIQAFRTPTTGSKLTHSNNVYAFPNPVRPEHEGTIAIKGLARDANVKITDIDGQLVYQTEALGGQAIWDGNDISGRPVTGGVYLVFSTSADAFREPDSFVTKIMVVR